METILDDEELEPFERLLEDARFGNETIGLVAMIHSARIRFSRAASMMSG